MRTTIYWTLQHIRQAVHEMRFCCSCWWLNQQIDILNLRLRLESSMPSMQYSGTAKRGIRIYADSL
jgi:hypothetical protein